jgi:hypothetical protein
MATPFILLTLLLLRSQPVKAATVIADDGAAKYNESPDTGWTDGHFRFFLDTSRLNQGSWHDCIRFEGDRPISMDFVFTGVQKIGLRSDWLSNTGRNWSLCARCGSSSRIDTCQRA